MTDTSSECGGCRSALAAMMAEKDDASMMAETLRHAMGSARDVAGNLSGLVDPSALVADSGDIL